MGIYDRDYMKRPEPGGPRIGRRVPFHQDFRFVVLGMIGALALVFLFLWLNKKSKTWNEQAQPAAYEEGVLL